MLFLKNSLEHANLRRMTAALFSCALLQIASTEPVLAARYEYTYSSGSMRMDIYHTGHTGHASIRGTLSFTADTNRDISFSINHHGQIVDSSVPLSNVAITFNDGVTYRRDHGFLLFDRQIKYGISDLDSLMRFSTDSSGVPTDWSIGFTTPVVAIPTPFNTSSLSTYTSQYLDGQGFVGESVRSLNFGYAGWQGNFPPYNPWHLTPVPEPSTVVLSAISGLALLGIAIRRRRTVK